ncbi:hypothetical protein JRG18_02510 [Kocuria palustris]|jgi:hypothetical protein|uniref:Uncharacterized protein n=1 Tax=Kocuria palustris PEL TaxID=1236550 RepID=M2XFY6_9MICC|nr:hypothetical protein [Kocuria palustris]ALB03078.1 hypothetical protein KPaMU14_05470 [Kocuria palustris]EME37976.1 hypothetical protein C884_00171 [Kocuria palustris PEL]MBN6752398.1 hypothetical protein [Kocuria palustris]MBN6757353.1 hypothetical protein [Kocuria palustris]MBN6762381.1 hypothetical protein [Kocuria palustris]
MRRIVLVVFWASLAVFLLLGLGIVAGQLAGVLLGSGSVVAGVASVLNWPAFSAATVCSLAAFVLGYLPDPDRPSTRVELSADN